MNFRRLIARMTLLSIIVLIFGTATVVFARTTLAPLAPAETYNGTLSGSIASTVSANARFLVTATGTLSDNVETRVYTTVVGPGPFTFNNVASGDDLGWGYSTIVSYTITAAPLAGCYALTPISYTAYLTPGTPDATGFVFTPTYIPMNVTVTARMTEAIFVPGIIPTTPVIVPPARSNGISFLNNINYRIQGPGVDATGVASGSGGSTAYSFTRANSGLMNTEPANGQCAQTYTVTVVSVQPYLNVINWKYVPASGVQAVNVATWGGSATANADFLAYHYWTWAPVVIREP